MWYVCARVTRDEGQIIAFAGCWIVGEGPEQARFRAIEIVSECGWNPEEVIDVRTITRDDYSDDDEGLPFFLQAELDGEVCVFFTSRQPDDEQV